MTPDETRNCPGVLRRWTTAVRPFAYPASLVPVVLGTSISHGAGYPVLWGRFTLAAMGVVAFHTAANLLNDVYDYRRGLDRHVQSNSGAVVRCWITQRQAFQVAGCCLGLGLVCAVLLTVLAGWVVPVLALPGIVFAVGYTAPRHCIKHAGLGDAAVFLSFGMLPVFGAWWVQTGAFAPVTLLWGLLLGLSTVGILHANNWRDLETDRARGCMTAAVRLGPHGSRLYYQALVLTPIALSTLYILLGRLPRIPHLAPPLAPIVWLALPLALRLARTRPEADPAALNGLDAKTALLHAVFGLLCVLAFAF